MTFLSPQLSLMMEKHFWNKKIKIVTSYSANKIKIVCVCVRAVNYR